MYFQILLSTMKIEEVSTPFATVSNNRGTSSGSLFSIEHIYMYICYRLYSPCVVSTKEFLNLIERLEILMKNEKIALCVKRIEHDEIQHQQRESAFKISLITFKNFLQNKKKPEIDFVPIDLDLKFKIPDDHLICAT